MRVLLGYMYMKGRQVARKKSSVWRSSSGRMGCSKPSSGRVASVEPGTYGTISSFLLISQYACFGMSSSRSPRQILSSY